MHYLPPETSPAEGRSWLIERVWPAASAPLPVEVRAADGVEPVLRAGWFHPGEGASASTLQLLPAGEDPRLKALASAAADGVVVSHRPGKRAVVRREGGAGGGGTRFVKVVRPGRTAEIMEGIRRAQAFDGPFRTPRVLGSDESTVSFEALRGTSLHEAHRFSAADWEVAWAQVLEAWETTIQHPGELPEGTPVHDADAEIAVLRRWAQHAQPVIEDFELLVDAVESAAHRLQEAPAGKVVPAHRDLHDKQLLWSPDHGPGVLDVDTACLAPPALDLANLRAHARWRAEQGVWSREQSAAVVRAINDTAYRAGVAQDTLSAYEQATLLRLGCVYAFRPRYPAAAAELRRALRSSLPG
ncbi:phosphotransferase family protein [Nesterenkonia lacusekhoensis]|uniref:Aminoglycoside phosphotransferase domain-containing protein n=1 Tax=Nesterenkonia lacusekhoensis TaxID=150832 RepID=A0ABS4SZD3_9MICC|nr:hypothetical protein [Nesterenkonia lacusekhoensis]